MTFAEWLSTKRGEDTPLGDLANDAASDRKWPSEATTRERFQVRLAFEGACTEARDTLDAAWRAYERSQGAPARDLKAVRRRDAAAAV
jgi:hypothetical protein